jgi:Uma2 family endonuclease
VRRLSGLYELDWIIDSETVLRPDLLILCGYKPERFVEKTPVFVGEVLSDSTRQRDLLYKREIYQQLGVKFYLVADPKTKATQVLVNGPDGFREGTPNLALGQGCSLRLSFDHLYE